MRVRVRSQALKRNQMESPLLPNTTQIPNAVIDQLMPTLKDVEFRVLMVIIRQTFGWIADEKTGRRKERDWISHYQLMKKTGRASTSISKAVDSLCKSCLILAYNSDQEELGTAHKRKFNFGPIYYRFNQNYDKNTLFPRSHFLRSQKVVATKETVLQKKSNNRYVSKAQRQDNLTRLKQMKKSKLKI